MLRVWLAMGVLAIAGCAAPDGGSPDAGHAVRGAYVGGSGGYGVH